MIKTFRIIAALEAASFLLLLAFVIAKYTGGDESGVQMMGPIHGTLVLVYAALVLALRDQQRWSLKTVLLLLLASAVPLGGFVVERRVSAESATTRASSQPT